MRITNKIIQNNSLNNINVNKTLEDQLSTMLSSNKKIVRPSDDPIIALRSLRLRTSVNQVTQYVEKNVEDAKSWLTVTEDAIKTLSDIITDVRKQYVKGTSDTLKAEDRTIITSNLEALAAELYNTGNADFAGRSVFTGFRTETTLTFQKQEDIDYTITEKLNNVTVDSVKYVNVADAENDVKVSDITRIRLSYDKVNNTKPSLTLNGTPVNPDDISVISSTADPNPYKVCADDADAIVFVPETGEIL
ncbi:MAG: flagellar biosynthesis protein FlgL, partial [Lachnospiraceae bacterium]|nr:flagellar biosynthesis protein FlgL [Lachnospiraceae bacterium]